MKERKKDTVQKMTQRERKAILIAYTVLIFGFWFFGPLAEKNVPGMQNFSLACALLLAGVFEWYARYVIKIDNNK